MAQQVFSLENPTFKYFIGYSAVVVAKTFMVAIATGFNRVTKRAFLNVEDAKSTFGGAPDGKPKSTPTIDRLMRLHRNDLENVLPFLMIGLLYVATKPDPEMALLHFRLFTGSRLLHSCIYALGLPINARATCWAVGLAACLSMTYSVFLKGAL